MDLFESARQEQIAREAPLAARMRPRTLDEYVGQEHVVGKGRLLRRAIEADQLSSLILYGPPGTGKTTLAMVIAHATRSRFVTLNAVLTGVKDIREVTKQAREDRSLYGQRTILFVDEVHRWDKRQQDALLPWVENGTIILIGATTENPYFSVNRPLLSRSRVFQLVPLTEEQLRRIARMAIADKERGYGELSVDISGDAIDHLVDVSNGDARSLLNAVELAVETTPPSEDGTISIDRAVAEESIQQRAVLYDREGDYHFDTISAFIKSLRGSDPDAALYWLAKMVYAGEDPRFIFRRMLILASEDVGLADPNALAVVEAAAAAFERIGLPEGQFPLAQAALYLATAPKSNSTLGYFDALQVVRDERTGDVPSHLKDGNRDKEGFGHGEGYLYPHAYRDHWVAQQYLPVALQGQMFYQPSDQGYEGGVKRQVERHREEQLAAAVGDAVSSGEVLTFSMDISTQERWLARAVSDAAQSLHQVRERVFVGAQVRRHDVVLDLHAGTGLLTWEAIRLAPEGGVWALARDLRSYDTLRKQADALDALARPNLMQGELAALQELLASQGKADLRYDVIVGRNALIGCLDRQQAAEILAGLLAQGGRISLAETIPRHGQRLYALANLDGLEDDLAGRLREAEEAIYSEPDNAAVAWDTDDLRGDLEKAGLCVEIDSATETSERLIGAAQLERWFGTGGDRKSYADLLAKTLLPDEIERVKGLYLRQLAGQAVRWGSRVAYVVARTKD